jgi:ribosomal protein S18 acetylase RimI-like enzyme
MIHCIVDSKDFETIRRIAFETWPIAYGKIVTQKQLDYMLEKMYTIASLQHQQENLGHRFILAVDESYAAIGFASFSTIENQHNHHRLHKLYVLPNQQQKGIGKLMLETIYSEIRKNGEGSIELNVNRYNNSLAFYQKLGFQILKEEDIDIGEGFFMNDYVLFKKVQ